MKQQERHSRGAYALTFAILLPLVTLLLVPLSAFWDAYWAAKIWNQFVVPLTAWRTLSWGIVALVVMTYQACAAYRHNDREGEGRVKYGLWIFGIVAAAPLQYVVAWVLYNWWLT